jgi:hypothetical protein
MSYHSKALYSNLLQDLSEQLPGTDLTVDSPWPGMSPREYQAFALKSSLLKKFKDVKEKDADALALEKFLASNIRCKNWELKLDNSGDEVLFGQFKHELYKFFTVKGYSLVTDAGQISDLGRVGPGSSVAAKGKDFFTKLFSSPLACTNEGLRTLYEHYVCTNPTWSKAEAFRFTEYGRTHIVAGNRLSFVDKNATISRVICSEPALNMFFQLGLGTVMENHLSRYFGIDVRTQPDKNRELARIASLRGDLCTIDLASASDSVSLTMLEQVLPADIVSWLKLFRSPTCTLPDGRVEPLYMVSSMGNGFTFPLESIIFACVVAAVYSVEGIPLQKTTCSMDVSPRELAHYFGSRRRFGLAFPHDPNQVRWEHGNFGVFGDDIIAESRAARKIIRLLNLLGFEVNSDKSFLEGPFRESCGADFFEGLPVRGVYIKSLKSQASRFVAINRLNEWCALTGFHLRRTIRYLLQKTRKIYVPLGENDDAGIKIPSRLATTLGCKVIGGSGSANDPVFGVVKYRSWAPVPSLLRVKPDSCEVRGPGNARVYNEYGLFLALLRGDMINCTIGLSNDNPKYSTKWSTTLYWDHVPTVGKQFPIGTKALVKAVSRNIPI